MCPVGGGPSEGAEAAHQTAEGGSEETPAEGRGQPGDQIQERKPKQHQVQYGERLLLGINGTAVMDRWTQQAFGFGP